MFCGLEKDGGGRICFSNVLFSLSHSMSVSSYLLTTFLTLALVLPTLKKRPISWWSCQLRPMKREASCWASSWGQAGEVFRTPAVWASPKKTLIGQSGRKRLFSGRSAFSGSVPCGGNGNINIRAERGNQQTKPCGTHSFYRLVTSVKMFLCMCYIYEFCDCKGPSWDKRN